MYLRRHFPLLCLTLGAVSVVMADSSSHQLLEFQRGHGAFVANLRRRNTTSTPSLANSTEKIFDPTFATEELKTVLSKYAQAEQFLAGIGLSPDPHAAEGYPPFKPPATLLQQVYNASVLQPDGPANKEDTPSILAFPGTAQLPLTDYIADGLDIMYYGPLNFGSQRQPLTVDIDTGSADLWVPMQCNACGKHQYSGSESSTFKSLGRRVSVNYGAGRISGTLVQDTVTLGNLIATDQTFVAVSSESYDFGDEPSAGLVGLAFGTIAQSRKPTFFETLLAQQHLAAGVFSVYLTRGQEVGSEVCFGCYDATKAKGPISWVPLVSQTYWSISMDSISPMQGQNVSTNLTAAIDTGTSLIYIPDDIAAQFYALIPGSQSASEFGPGFYTFPCSAPLAVSFSFNNLPFAVNMLDFNLGLATAGSSDCVGGILGLGSGFPADLAIVGDSFLKSYYSVFDYAGARIGFAPGLNEG